MLCTFTFILLFLQTGLSTAVSPCPDCNGDNVVCVDGFCLLRCVNVTSSGDCLQCRDSRFYGKDCEKVCPYTCLNSTCQLINSGVVCIAGCVSGKKGDRCGVDCPGSCTQCEQYSGKCTGPCSSSLYYGDSCEMLCCSGCKGGCNKTGVCFG